MKKSISIVVFTLAFLSLIFTQCDEAYAVNDQSAEIARSVLYELALDTAGVDGYSLNHAMIHAREAISQTGKDIGVPFTKYIYTDTAKMGVFVDTGLLFLNYVIIDTLIDDEFLIPLRNLMPVELDSMMKLADHETSIFLQNNATNYYWQRGSDSIWITPIGLDKDTFTVWGYKEATYLSDSTVTTNIPQKYRWAAIMYGCHLASLKLENGRAQDYLAIYENIVKKIWVFRIGRPLVETGE